MLNPTVLLRIGLWAAAYKFRLPQNEAWVRGLVFRAFAGKPKAEVDAFLHDFYDECVAPHVREQARQAMDAWREQGVSVVCVSAYLRAHHRARHARFALRFPDIHAYEGGLRRHVRLRGGRRAGRGRSEDDRAAPLSPTRNGARAAGSWWRPTATITPTVRCSLAPSRGSPYAPTARLGAPPASAAIRCSSGKRLKTACAGPSAALRAGASVSLGRYRP